MAKYIGFSSLERNLDTRLTDKDLVRRDILNHFAIRPGEIRGRPNFGSIIHRLHSMPNDETTRKQIEEEVKNIVAYDPRVSIQDVAVDYTRDSITIGVSINYVELGLTEWITFQLTN